MGEKRFERINHTSNPFWIMGIKDNWTGKEYKSLQECIDLLNTLSKENILLKNEFSLLKGAYEVRQDGFDRLFSLHMQALDEFRLLLEENEKLKKDNEKLQEDRDWAMNLKIEALKGCEPR